MRRSFKYRLWTNSNQSRELDIMLETHRRLYNSCLDARKLAYETTEITLKYSQQSAAFKLERKINPFYARLNFSSAQATMRRLDRSFQNFFRRIKNKETPGYPRFKARDRYSSIEFPAHGDGIRLTGDRLRVQNVGIIRVKLHRPVQGDIKTLTLKKESNKWYLVVSCDLGEVTIQQSTNPEVGIDVGLEHFLTTSDGDHEPNPRYLKKNLDKLRVASRSVSRKKKGGKNRRKKVLRLRRIHERIRNLRRDHHHKTALKLVRRYGVIAVETLDIAQMLGNHRLALAISDAGWAGFLETLKYKAESAGVSVVEVDARGTSQTCSGCGKTVPKTLWDRVHSCPHCGLTLHRDHNSALIILARARLARTGPVSNRIKVA